MANKLDDLKKVADKAGATYAENVSFKGLEKIIKEHNEKPTEEPAQDLDEAIAEGNEPEPEEFPELDEPKPEPMKPLNASAFPDEVEDEITWSGKPKRCAGTASMYDDTEENFPVYKTLDGDRTDYCKNFLDSRVEAKMLVVKDGIYSSK